MKTDVKFQHVSMSLALSPASPDLYRDIEIIVDGKIKGILILPPTIPGQGNVYADGGTPLSRMMHSELFGMHAFYYRPDGSLLGHQFGSAENWCIKNVVNNVVDRFTTNSRLVVSSIIPPTVPAITIDAGDWLVPNAQAYLGLGIVCDDNGKVFLHVHTRNNTPTTVVNVNMIVVTGEDAVVQLLKCNSPDGHEINIKPNFVFSACGNDNGRVTSNTDIYVGGTSLMCLGALGFANIDNQINIIERAADASIRLDIYRSFVDVSHNPNIRTFNWIPDEISISPKSWKFNSLYVGDPIINPDKAPLPSLMFIVETGDLQVDLILQDYLLPTTPIEITLPNNIQSFFYTMRGRATSAFDQIGVTGIGFQSLDNDSVCSFNQVTKVAGGLMSCTDGFLWRDISLEGTTVVRFDYTPESMGNPATLEATNNVNYLLNSPVIYPNFGKLFCLSKAAPFKEHTTDSLLAITPNIIVSTITTDSALVGQLLSSHTTDSSIIARLLIEHNISSLIATDRSLHTTNSSLRGTVSIIHTTNNMLYNLVSLDHTSNSNLIPFQIYINGDIKVDSVTGVLDSTNIEFGDQPPNPAYCKNYQKLFRNC